MSEFGSGAFVAANLTALCVDSGRNPTYYNFDSIFWALVSVFQSFTGVGWSDQMYKVQDAWGWPAFVYFMLLVVFGMWIMANLLIAVLGDSYTGMYEQLMVDRKRRRAKARDSARILRGSPMKDGKLRPEANAWAARLRAVGLGPLSTAERDFEPSAG